MRRRASHRIDAGGVALHVEVEGEGRPVALLHGFTGSSRSMAPVAAGLRDAYRTLCIDLLGHGRSDAPEDVSEYAMARCVAQLAAVLDALGAPRVHLIGYSMGGRAALALCAAYPERVASALLVGARAGIEDAAARAQRIRDDELLARRIESEGVAAFVDRWMALPLFASQKRLGAAWLAEARRERLANRAHGLAQSLRGLGAGAQPPLHDRLPEIRVPIRLVVGSEDPKFHAIAADLARRLPDARVERIPEAGHAAHLENPRAFLRLARRLFAEVDAAERTSPVPPEIRPAQLMRESTR